MIQKHVLCPQRVRRLPKADWAWVERRFQRQFASKLSGDAIFLYFILVAVSDKNGLSFYSDNSLALMIRVSLPSLSKARQELLNLDLIAFEAPLVQVLSLPPDPQSRPRVSQSDPSAAEALDLQMLIAALARRIRAAYLPKMKTLTEYDFSFPKRIAKQKILRLSDLQFIDTFGCAVLP